MVEDDAATRAVMKECLLKYGELQLAEDGFEAIDKVKQALIQEKYFELILLDIELPLMQGVQVVKVVRSFEELLHLGEDKKCRIIMLSGSSSVDVIKSAFREHCDGYLLKPFSEIKFKQNLQKLDLPIPE